MKRKLSKLVYFFERNLPLQIFIKKSRGYFTIIYLSIFINKIYSGLESNGTKPEAFLSSSKGFGLYFGK